MFGVGSARKLDGAVTLAGDVSATGLTVALDSTGGKALAIHEHGGAKGGLSCGRTTTVQSLKLALTTDKLNAEAKLQLEAPGEKVLIETKPPHLTWTWASKCPCPDDGSLVDVTLPRPGGDDGEMTTLAVAFKAGVGDSCRSVAATLPQWPTECDLKDKVVSACGEGPRDAAQTVASELGTRMCVGLQ